MRTSPLLSSVAELPDFAMPYLEGGAADGVPLVLIHGLTDSMRSFEPVLEALSDSIHAYAITQRGHGDAGRPHKGYEARELAHDVIEFMDVVGIEQAVVTGHSHGATVARRIASDHPERVLGCVLAGAFSPYREQPGLRGLLAEFDSLQDPVSTAYAREWQESTLANAVPETFLEMVIAETRKAPIRVWNAALQGMIDERDDPQGEIDAPVLLAWGEQDALVSRADQDDLLAAIPHAELVAYAGAGHALHWEQPARFAAELARFAATSSPRRASRR